MHKRAFTLIELLVVIAIIAILAAILFPVFAQAKLAAKKTQALSNTKQLGTSLQIYLGDSDDTYPYAFGSSNWTGQDLWCQRVQPYCKSIAIFGSPADSQAGQTASIGSWAGVGISFAANSLYGDWDGTGFELRGPMGVIQYSAPNVQNDAAWLHHSQNNASVMTNPAATILIAEKHGDDINKWDAAYNGGAFNDHGNFSAFAMGGVISGSHTDGIGWGPQNEPNGTRLSTNAYEYGPNGAVSSSYSNQAVFTYLDGHAKSSTPGATNPDPVNKKDLNQWDGKR